MQAELAASLCHLAEAAAAALPDISARLAARARAIEAGEAMPPLGFRAYYRLVPALQQGDAEGIAAALSLLEAQGVRAPGRRLMRCGEAAAAPMIAELASEFAAEGMALADVSAKEAEAFDALLAEGLALMEQALPELHGEMAALVHELLLARSPEGAAMVVDGASHSQFWGLLLLNPDHHPTPLKVIEAMAHEAAHGLLFGHTVHEPLVLNPDAEHYPSPLRRDPRPMDGIYHATFVSARMAWAMEALAASGKLAAEETAFARNAAAEDRANWANGLSVVLEHGRLSPTGATLLKAAGAFIDAA